MHIYIYIYIYVMYVCIYMDQGESKAQLSMHSQLKLN